MNTENLQSLSQRSLNQEHCGPTEPSLGGRHDELKLLQIHWGSETIAGTYSGISESDRPGFQSHIQIPHLIAEGPGASYLSL